MFLARKIIQYSKNFSSTLACLLAWICSLFARSQSYDMKYSAVATKQSKYQCKSRVLESYVRIILVYDDSIQPPKKNKFVSKIRIKQECIPVGCVPPAAVAVGGSPSGTPRDQTPPGPGQNPTLPMNRITDTCKNITFPQLRLRAVIMTNFYSVHNNPTSKKKLRRLTLTSVEADDK